MAGILELLNGQGGSLLDFLRANGAAAINNVPGALPSDTANYGPTPAPMSFAPPPQVSVNQPNAINSASWPQPISAPMKAAAMPSAAPMSIAGPAPAAPRVADTPAPEGDNRFILGLKGLIGNLHNGPIGALAGGIGAAITGQPTDADSIAAQQSNLTARAMIAKGADPVAVAAAAKNPMLMAELIKQYYGPQTVTPLGSGYVWDARQGKAVKAYEPDAKPPTSLGSGYIWNPETGKVERAFTPEDKKETPQEQMAQREQALIARGIDPKDPRNQQFILTGKFPREDAQPLTATDKKFIEEADDAVFASRNAITALNAAKKLSRPANSGWLATERAWLGNNLPDYLVPDFISSPDSSDATVNYSNIVLGQALSQLKAIFGAAPTEGERKVLLELQASVDKPDKIRQQILDRAIELAQSRLQYYQERADSLRGGVFYKPDYKPAYKPPSAGGLTGTTSSGITWSVQ